MSGAVIWSNKGNAKLAGYESLCGFLEMLNSREAPEIARIALRPLFSAAINPVIKSKIPRQNVKVLYPFGGADSVTGFLLPNVAEVVMIDYAFFYDENTKLSTSAMEKFEIIISSKEFFENFSGLGTFDVTQQQSGIEVEIIEKNANTMYHESSRQTCYAILMRLKAQLGAKFEQLSFIDPEHKDLGFVINFVDTKGNKRILKYFQRSNCTEKGILTMGRAEGATALAERTKAIQKEAATANIVLFKAASGLAESAVVLPILKDLNHDVQIISDSPYNEEDVTLLKAIAKQDTALQFVPSGEGNVMRLGYSNFGEHAAMISNAEAYKNAISILIQKRANSKALQADQSQHVLEASNNYYLILKHILYGDEENAISNLKINSQELEKILADLYPTLRGFGDLKLESILKATVTTLLSNKIGGPLNYNQLSNTLRSDWNFRFLDMMLSNVRHIRFPSEQKEKEVFAKILFTAFAGNNITLNDELKKKFLQAMAVCSEYMHLSHVEMRIMFKKNFKGLPEKDYPVAQRGFLQLLDNAISASSERYDSEREWEISLLQNLQQDLPKNFVIQPDFIITCLKRQNDVASLALTLRSNVQDLTNRDHIKQIIQLPSFSYAEQMIKQEVEAECGRNLIAIINIVGHIKYAALEYPVIRDAAIILLNSIRDGIPRPDKITAERIYRSIIKDAIHELGGKVSNEIDASHSSRNINKNS